MTINSLSFVFTDELPEQKQVNTVYFINNVSYKKIVVINNDVENFASFDVKPEIDALLNKEFIALGMTKEQARTVIEAAHLGHSHNQTTQSDNGFLTKEDKTKIDELTNLTELEATNPDSLKTGLVSGKTLELAIKETAKNYNPETIQEIGTVYTGTVKPKVGTWIETGNIYLKSVYPELYEKLGSLLEDNYQSFETIADASATLQINYGNSNSHQFTANDIFAVYLNSTYINIVRDPKNIATTSSATIGFSESDQPKGVFTKDKNCVVVGSFTSTNITEFLQSRDGVVWTKTSVPYFCDKFFFLDGLFIGFNSTGYFITTDLINATYFTSSEINYSSNNRGFKVNNLYYFYNDVTKTILVSSDFINFTPVSGLTPNSLLQENLSYDVGLYYTKFNTSGTSWLVSTDGITFVQKSLPEELTVGGTGAAFISWFKTRFIFFRTNCKIQTSSDGEVWSNVTHVAGGMNTRVQLGFNNGPNVLITDNAILCLTFSGLALTFNGVIWEPSNSSISGTYLEYQKILDGYSRVETANVSIFKNKRLDFNPVQKAFTGNGSPAKVMFVVGGIAFLAPTSGVGLDRVRVVSYDTSTQFYVPQSTEQNRNNYKSWILAKRTAG